MYIAENLMIYNPLFQFVTAFSNFDFSSVVWEQYQQYAIPTIENATKDLQQAIHVIPTFTPDEAVKQLFNIRIITKSIENFKAKIESENDKEFKAFKSASLSFFKVLQQIENALEKSANLQDTVRAAFHHRIAHQKNPAILKRL